LKKIAGVSNSKPLGKEEGKERKGKERKGKERKGKKEGSWDIRPLPLSLVWPVAEHGGLPPLGP
jgi:hypothetical protein